MPAFREIVKVGLIVTDGGRVLLLKKRSGPSYILPGGKPESGEDDIQALVREIDEELGCDLERGTITFLGSFSDVAADLENTTVTVRLYQGHLLGQPRPRAEIESLKWYRPGSDEAPLAPSIKNKILPFLSSGGYFETKRYCA